MNMTENDKIVLEIVQQACDGLITAEEMTVKIEKHLGAKIERSFLEMIENRS